MKYSGIFLAFALLHVAAIFASGVSFKREQTHELSGSARFLGGANPIQQVKNEVNKMLDKTAQILNLVGGITHDVRIIMEEFRKVVTHDFQIMLEQFRKGQPITVPIH